LAVFLYFATALSMILRPLASYRDHVWQGPVPQPQPRPRCRPQTKADRSRQRPSRESHHWRRAEGAQPAGELGQWEDSLKPAADQVMEAIRKHAHSTGGNGPCSSAQIFALAGRPRSGRGLRKSSRLYSVCMSLLIRSTSPEEPPRACAELSAIQKNR
jgi:hypothetical protein